MLNRQFQFANARSVGPSPETAALGNFAHDSLAVNININSPLNKGECPATPPAPVPCPMPQH